MFHDPGTPVGCGVPVVGVVVVVVVVGVVVVVVVGVVVVVVVVVGVVVVVVGVGLGCRLLCLLDRMCFRLASTERCSACFRVAPTKA